MNYKKFLPDAICVLLFAIISFCYFYPADFDGRRLTQHDNSAGDGLSVEIQNYRAEHGGETPRWINSIFGGMPTYQVAPSYSSTRTMAVAEKAYHLWFPDYVWYIFASMLGFYILLRAFDFRHWMAALGAVVWAFSSYFFIIIAAGHIWKVITLAYIPPTIAGMVLLYRGRLLWGGLVTAFFAALQVMSNHVQMTYYFIIPELCLFVAFLIQALREKQMPRFFKATGILIAAAVIAVMINASNLFHTYEYAKDTIRGKSELVKQGTKASNQTSSGLDRDYITAWSYGLSETWTFLIPDVKGGASVPLQASKKAMEKADPMLSNTGVYGAFTQYWGDQPMTSGPVYLGALVCMLFVLALIIVPNRSPFKWALLAATILSVLLSWGKNFMPFTDFFIDHIPMYAKFRTVSSILVVAEFTIPLLGLIGLKQFVDNCAQPRKRVFTLRALTFATLLTGVCCLAFALAPTGLGDCICNNDRDAITQYVSMGYFDQATGSSILSSISTMRAAMLTSDAWRSLLIILIGAALMYFYFKKSGKALHEEGAYQFSLTEQEEAERKPMETSVQLQKQSTILCILLLAICLIDMWSVNKRYLNDSMFETPKMAQVLEKTDADEYILNKSGNGRDYRVLNLTVSTFNDNTTSYFYSSIGGYHPAKLRRYQELIEARIAPEVQNISKALQEARLDTMAMMAAGDVKHPIYDFSSVNTDSLFPVINMLNTRWFILGNQQTGKVPVENTTAYGNAWFVDNVHVVDNANEELDALHQFSPRHTAIVAKDFAEILGGQTEFDTDSAATIKQTALTSTSVSYETDSKKTGLAVFSEIYYPGWKVTIDGQEAQIIRTDYVLRAMLIPAGQHKIEMTFNPESVKTTETIAYCGLGLLILAFLATIGLAWKKNKDKKAA